MTLRIPTDCGNSPRMAIVAELVRSWAAGDEAAVHEWLREDARWVLVGADSANGVIVGPPFVAERGEILAVMSHGRLAACDGYLVRGAERVDFCHVLRFAGAAKTAKVVEIRTYLQPAPG